MTTATVAVPLKHASFADLETLVGRTDVWLVAKAVPPRAPTHDKAARKAAEVQSRTDKDVQVAGRVRWARGLPGRLEFRVDGEPSAHVVWTQDSERPHLSVAGLWFIGPADLWIGTRP